MAKCRTRFWLSRVFCVALVLALSMVTAGAKTARKTATEDTVLNAVELPISLERIRRKLDRLPASDEERNLLRLDYYIEVYGHAPDLNVLDGFDIHNGPVPYGSSHWDILAVTTPRHFKSPVANIGSVIGWTSWKDLLGR